MATPVPALQSFEFVIRRTFWCPMVQIVLWNIFSCTMYIVILRTLQGFEMSFIENRLYLLFHLIGLIGTVWIFLRWNAVKYTITERKIVVEGGILNIDRDTFLFRNIECVKLHKNILGRICWFGTIEMYAPTLQEHIFLRHISSANKVFQLIQKSIAEHRRANILYPSLEQRTSLLEGEKMKMAKGNLF